MRTLIRLVAIFPFFTLSVLSAGEVYRSVDKAGNVTYTDIPPEGGVRAERVEIPPAPSPERLRKSEQRNQEIMRAAEAAKRERQRENEQRQSRVSKAREQLAEAEAKLEQARVIQDEDRQNLAGGRRRIHPDYFERVKQAEADVEKARKALRQVRGY